MSLFQCEACGCRENTACCHYWISYSKEDKRSLCSACDPDIGEWHGIFPRLILPKGQFKTNFEGNLEHIETGITDVSQFEIKGGE
jgi:hypothetical protein